MDHEEVERLKFRKQYLLAPLPVECPFQHKQIRLSGNYTLYYHLDLKTTQCEQHERKLILLGDLFDFRNPVHDNLDILTGLITKDFTTLLNEIGAFTGKFALIIQDGSEIWIVHDPMTARKVFYSSVDGVIWIASQPYLLATILNCKPSGDPDKMAFYSSGDFTWLLNSNIGDTTIYDEIKQLRANHTLHINQFEIKRYWPNGEIERLSVNDAASRAAAMIEGYMKSIINRYDVMIPVTSGKDSRTLVAATKGFKQKPFYYINFGHNLSESHPDVTIPRKLFSALCLKFHILRPPTEIDKDFERIFFENNPYASAEFLPVIYNYYLQCGERINLPGNMPTAAFDVYGARNMRITGKSLAKLNRVGRYPYAIDYYRRWIDETKACCQGSGIHLLHLFYWEERLGNWGTQIQMDKEISTDDINLFNSRDLAILYLSVPSRYIVPPYYRLQKKVIKNLWPELLHFPINPGFHTTLLKFMKVFGALWLYRRLKYSWINGY